MAKRDETTPDQPRQRVVLLGVGFDDADGHLRVTKGPDFRLLGGSQQTHERMQEQASRMQDELDRRGKTLSEVDSAEFAEIARKAGLGEPRGR